jgi:hypothetical protein
LASPPKKDPREAAPGQPHRQEGAVSTPAELVVLHSVNRLLATKRFCWHPKDRRVVKSAYGQEKHFRIQVGELAGFDHLARCLDHLTRRHHAFVIRGDPLPSTDRERARRLLHDDPDTGDPATFAEAPRHWFAVDLDKTPCPAHVDLLDDPDGAIDYLLQLLPPELYEASCWWQFTSSQGLPGCENTVSARLWFWNRDPLDDASLTRWALAANKAAGRRLIDDSLYRAVQPHYIANPIFDGMPDPVPRRCGIRRGFDECTALVIPEPDRADPYEHGGGGFVGRGVEAFLADIGGPSGFRSPIVGAVASYYAVNGPGADPETIKSRLRATIAAAPPGGRGDRDITRYCSERHLNDIVGWVRAREKVNPRSRAIPLPSLAASVPVEGERDPAIRAIAKALLRARHLPPDLAATLTHAFNELRCSPPLPREQVTAIVDTAASRQIAYEERRHHG